jgi:hypothetical protein
MGKTTAMPTAESKTIRSASQKTGVTLFTTATAGLRFTGNVLEMGARWSDKLLFEQTRDHEVASATREIEREEDFIAVIMDRDQRLAKIKGITFDMASSYAAAEAKYKEMMSDFN